MQRRAKPLGPPRHGCGPKPPPGVSNSRKADPHPPGTPLITFNVPLHELGLSVIFIHSSAESPVKSTTVKSTTVKSQSAATQGCESLAAELLFPVTKGCSMTVGRYNQSLFRAYSQREGANLPQSLIGLLCIVIANLSVWLFL